MMAQAFHLLFGFHLHIVHKRLVARVDIAGEHKVLPNQKSHLVAVIVESVMLVNSAAPNPYHVHIRILSLHQKLSVAVISLAAGKHAGIRRRRNPVRAAHKERFPVDDELERLTNAVLFPH